MAQRIDGTCAATRGGLTRLLAAVALAALTGTAAQAADKPEAPKAAQSIWERDTLTGDWGGARTALKDKGIDISLVDIEETFGVLSGGLQRRGSFEGRVEFSVDADLEKLIGWKGGRTHVTIYQIHDTGHDANDFSGTLLDPSNIDALATTRVFTAWYEHNFYDRFSVRFGELAADDEFFTSDTAGGLINGTFGWAGTLSNNMTSGGPAYPLTAPGIRVKAAASENLTVLAAVFAGDPAGANCNRDPQSCNLYGPTTDLAGGSLWIGEVQYNVAAGLIGLPGTYKLGGWYATTQFADQRFGVDAAGGTVSLADPAVVGPLNHQGNGGIYAIADQMVWRQGDQSLNLFVRTGINPNDRNLLSFYIDGGAGFKGLLPGRADDVLTFGVSYAKFGSAVTGLDQDALALNGAPFAVRNAEMIFELNYALQLTPWWVLQPDLQYFVNPNGGQNPDDPTQTIKHSFLAGVRSTIKF